MRKGGGGEELVSKRTMQSADEEDETKCSD